MRLALVGFLVLPLLIACGAGAVSTPVPATDSPATGAPATGAPATDAPATDAPATDAPAADAVDVQIADFAFDPRSATAPVGAEVTWTNQDSAPHTVTFDDGVDLGQVDRDGTLTRTFEAPGEFAYMCTIHPSMRGVVVVQ